MESTRNESVNISRNNNFSIIRLVFSALVILSHSSELIYGDASHELLTLIFGTISFGTLAVDGFFLVSGYLITQSYFSSSTKNYTAKRILRIYPGFLCASIFLICLGKYVSNHNISFTPKAIFDNIVNVVFLMPPIMNNPYPGYPFPDLNGSMWTIAYEFRCYLIILLLGVCGLFLRKNFLLGLTVMLGIIFMFHPDLPKPYHPAISTNLGTQGIVNNIFNFIRNFFIESRETDLRLTFIFLTGICFYLFQNKIKYSHRGAFVAAFLLVLCLKNFNFAEPGLALFGGYIIFWFACHVRPLAISQFFNTTDLSYGIYLYAWPIQKTLIAAIVGVSFLQVAGLTLLLCGVIAFFSWILVEKPCLRLKTVF